MERQGDGQIAVVTGAGKISGLGFEVCRQLGRAGVTVVLTARNGAAAEARAAELRTEGLYVRAHQLDVESDASVGAFATFVRETVGNVDILVNNAAATSSSAEQPSTADLLRARAAMDATMFGAWRLTRALVPLLSDGARVVNVSSGAGSHGDPAFGLMSKNAMGPAYAVAKAALNALTSLFAKELAGKGVLVNAVCPGFTATFPGGREMGARPVPEGAAGILWAAMLPAGSPSGGFFRDAERLPW